jgi:F-type H+-transporting ATPase subunit b
MKRAQPPRSDICPRRLPRLLWRPTAAGATTLVVPALAAASEGGLVLVPDPALLLALILLFVVLIFPVNSLVFRPLLRVLDEREERIAGTRSRAAKLEGEAADLLARYERSVAETRDESERGRRALLEEVRAEAQRETAAARGEAESRIEQARREVADSLEGARATLRAQSQDLAREAAAQVLGRAL